MIEEFVLAEQVPAVHWWGVPSLAGECLVADLEWRDRS